MNIDNMKPYLRLFRTFFSVAVIVFLVSSCASVQLNQKNWAEKTMKKLTLRQKIAQMMIYRMHLKYASITPQKWDEIKSLLDNDGIGGIHIWSGDGSSSLSMLNEIQRRSKIPIVIDADIERGLGQRFSSGTDFPPLMAITATGNPNNAYEVGAIVAKESRAAGVQWNLSPVVDVNNNPLNPIINTRSFSENPGIVSEYAAQYIRGLQENGMISTAKHFPGHGDTQTDSHSSLAMIPSDSSRLWSVELKPFFDVANAGVDAIMIAHVHAPDFQPESDIPATLSKFWVTDILKNKNRIDGRGLADVRPIMCEVGVLPRVHRSALFTRGETQAIVTTTLGTSDDEQRIESLDGLQRERFMLHYNFPPFSVGETGRIGTGRREIGHGKLAWRAINSSLPSKEAFPYTFRIVSEITESNGSSSMATVCGASLALMDAGVPIKEPVAGIAMGLIKEGDDFSVLSDILGDEDHLGDMDFKVAGTKDGITSLQMDIKITGITFEIMEQALKQAKDGRIHILGEMNKALNKSRDSVGKHTPKMEKITVDKKDIATVIGKGGATIREIVEKSGAKVDVSDDGTVTVAAPDEDSRNKAMQIIKDLTAKAELNKIYNGKVMKIMEFGAFVNFLGKQDGLVHISELADKRVAKVTDVVKEGDEVKVKVIGFDRGKVKLSIKQAAI